LLNGESKVGVHLDGVYMGEKENISPGAKDKRRLLKKFTWSTFISNSARENKSGGVKLG